VRVRPHAKSIAFGVAMAPDAGSPLADTAASPPDFDQPPKARWPTEVMTAAMLSHESRAYVVDDIPLPVDNPWRRRVRAADVQFFPDGRAAIVTFDGDLWIAQGLQGDLNTIRWRRFASGLHEPLSVAIRNGELFVYDRNGIWRIKDTDDDGEADVYELFSNAFTQTAETREFATSIKVSPDGSFVIGKGGQASSTLGKGQRQSCFASPPMAARARSSVGGFRQPIRWRASCDRPRYGE